MIGLRQRTERTAYEEEHGDVPSSEMSRRVVRLRKRGNTGKARTVYEWHFGRLCADPNGIGEEVPLVPADLGDNLWVEEKSSMGQGSMDLRLEPYIPGQIVSLVVGRTWPLLSCHGASRPAIRVLPSVGDRLCTAMRLGRYIPIPRILHSAFQRRPPPFLPHSLNPTTAPTYNRLYNSSLASNPTASADANSNVITQRLTPDRSQSTPIHEYSKLVEAGKLRADDYQTQIIQKLQALHDALALYDPPPLTDPPSLVRGLSFSVSPQTQLSSLTPLALAPFLPSCTKRYES